MASDADLFSAFAPEVKSLYIGIDPGKLGGIAAIDDRTGEAKAWPMPATERDVWELLHDLAFQGVVMALIEEQSGRPPRRAPKKGWTCPRCKRGPCQVCGAGMPAMGAKSLATFMTGYGGLRMAVVGCDIRLETVTALKWQTALKCRTGGDKNVSKRRAQELFPGLRITHKIADALLLAEYGRRTYR